MATVKFTYTEVFDAGNGDSIAVFTQTFMEKGAAIMKLLGYPATCEVREKQDMADPMCKIVCITFQAEDVL